MSFMQFEIIVNTFSVRGSTLGTDVNGRQILTSKVDPRTLKINYLKH